MQLKDIVLWCLIIACGMITAYLCFISLVSIWIGIAHSHQSGWWIPVLTGTSVLIAVFLAFLRTAVYLSSHIKKKGMIVS
jgi:hypothetical protein